MNREPARIPLSPLRPLAGLFCLTVDMNPGGQKFPDLPSRAHAVGSCDLHTHVLRHQLAQAHTHRYLRCTRMSKGTHTHSCTLVCAHTSLHSSFMELGASHGPRTGPPSCQTTWPRSWERGYEHPGPHPHLGPVSTWGDKRTRTLCGETQLPDFPLVARESPPLPALPNTLAFLLPSVSTQRRPPRSEEAGG